MRKFLLAVCCSLFSCLAAAEDLPARAGLAALRAPTEAIVREAAKGPDADLAVVGQHNAEIGKAWQLVMSEPLDLARYGVPVERHEEAWRQVRTLVMVVAYLDESVKRGDRALMLRAAGMLAPAYEKLAGMLGAH